MSNLNSVFVLDPARARVNPQTLVPAFSVTSGQIKGYLHLNFLCFDIDDGSLGEARVWPTRRREIRPSLTGCTALGIVDPYICEVLVFPLASEDEYRFARGFEKHGMT